MDLSVILTYRCNSRCSMCHLWQHPTVPSEEITPATLAKLPNGFNRLVLTGGEPTLRTDLEEIVALLRPKARRLEILTNGLRTEPLERIARRHPDVRFRVSLDGVGFRNDAIRGETNGFRRKEETLRRLAAAGIRRPGFAVVVQDDNCDQLPELHAFCRGWRGDLDATVLHNAYQFHKIDNEPVNRLRTARAIGLLAEARLRSARPRDWFRAARDLGLMQKVLGQPRRFPCPAGRDFLFLDPWARVYACNVRPDLEIGDLSLQTWREILNSPRAAEARTRVARCTHNCRLDGPARAALRGRLGLPRPAPLAWVLASRLRVLLGMAVPFERVVDFRDVAQSAVAPRRESWLGKPFRPTFQHKTEQPYGAYNNVMNK